MAVKVDNIVNAFAEKNEDAIENALDKFSIEDGKIYYKPKGENPVEIPVKDFNEAKALLTKVKKDRDGEKKRSGGTDYDPNDYETIFNKLGRVALMRSAPKVIGKADKPEDLAKAINGANYDDVYDIAFEKDPKIPQGKFNGRSPYEVMEACARRKAVEELHDKQKIDDEKYSQLVKGEGKEKEYSKDIATDAATKNKYLSIKNRLEKQFRAGVVDARKDLDEGKNMEEPFTNRSLNLEDGEIKKALKGAAKNAAGKIGDILGISQNSPDIFSKLIFASIAGGNKLWKAFKAKGALKKFNSNAPKEVQQAVAKVTQEISAVKDHTDQNVETNFDKVQQDVENMQKIVGQYMASKPEFKDRIEKVKAFLDKTNHQAIPSLWGLSAAIGMRGDVQRVIESYSKQAELLELLTEADMKKRKQQMAKAKAQAQQRNRGSKKPPKQSTDDEKTDTQTAETPAEEKPDENKPEAPAENKPQENQQEETGGKEAIQKLMGQVDELMKIEKSGEFMNKYNEWVKTVDELIKKAGERENLKQAVAELSKKEDPYERLCLLDKAVNSQPEEKEESNTEETDEQGNSEADTAGSKPDSDDINDKEMGDGLTAESLEDDLIIHNFFRRLDEKLK
jgi:hypothetical protein